MEYFLYSMYIMPRYCCNYSYFREVEPVYYSTQVYDSEKNVVDEMIQYLTVDVSSYQPLLEASYYIEVEGHSWTMSQPEYSTYLKTVINTFNDLIKWCEKYDRQHDFNNFQTGWSVSLSIYHT